MFTVLIQLTWDNSSNHKYMSHSLLEYTIICVLEPIFILLVLSTGNWHQSLVTMSRVIYFIPRAQTCFDWVTWGKSGERVGANKAEWTREVEIRKKEIWCYTELYTMCTCLFQNKINKNCYNVIPDWKFLFWFLLPQWTKCTLRERERERERFFWYILANWCCGDKVMSLLLKCQNGRRCQFVKAW